MAFNIYEWRRNQMALLENASNLPAGAASDPNAPFNQKEPSFRSGKQVTGAIKPVTYDKTEYLLIDPTTKEFYYTLRDNFEDMYDTLSDYLDVETETEYDEEGPYDITTKDWKENISSDELLAALADYLNDNGGSVTDSQEKWEDGETEFLKITPSNYRDNVDAVYSNKIKSVIEKYLAKKQLDEMQGEEYDEDTVNPNDYADDPADYDKVAYLAQTFQHVWGMGKRNNTVDFDKLAKSVIKDLETRFINEALFLYSDEEMKKGASPKEYTDKEIDNMSLEAAKKLYKGAKNNWNVPHNHKLANRLRIKIEKEDPKYFKTKKQ